MKFYFSVSEQKQTKLQIMKWGNKLEAQGGDNYLSPLEWGLANQLYGYYWSDSGLKNIP